MSGHARPADRWGHPLGLGLAGSMRSRAVTGEPPVGGWLRGLRRAQSPMQITGPLAKRAPRSPQSARKTHTLSASPCQISRGRLARHQARPTFPEGDMVNARAKEANDAAMETMLGG